MSVFALLERLAPYIENEVNLDNNSKQEVETLSSKLKKIQVGLQDAERKSVTDQNVKDWIKELEDLVYEMEYVLDEWEAMNVNLQLEADSEDECSSNPWEKVRSLVLSLCSCFEHVLGRRELVLKMKTLSARLDEIVEEKDKYNFVQNEGINSGSKESISRESTCLLDKSWVDVGRDVDKESLIRKLVPYQGEDPGRGTDIISVVGVGGVGKTALAQIAYNEPQVEAYFELRAWVFVGDPFDPTKIAKAILEALEGSNGAFNDSSTLNILVGHIRKIVSDKRFLLVLDDVWTEERSKWEQLKNCLSYGALGSRILVTTRNEAVARVMGTKSSNLQRLNILSDMKCGTILNAIALEGRSEDEQTRLRDKGMEIAKKCNGLPLAAKAVGIMLALKITEAEWQDVLESPLWKYEDEGISDLFRLLKLSYLELHPILKCCFLSCILYPKGSWLLLDEQIQKWLGYGYISSSDSEDEVQRKGLQYFQKLAMRSFIERANDVYGVIQFKVHDIIHDFARYVLESEQNRVLIMEPISLEAVDSSPYKKVHHKDFSIDSIERLRCFSAIRASMEEFPHNLFSLLKCVRLLIVVGCNLQELPPEVGKLIHVRYLDLSWNPIRELPSTMAQLYNLQTLDVQSCAELSKLPHGIDKLINLRYLVNKNTPSLKDLPQGLQRLTGLRTLSKFVAGEKSSTLSWLENLNQLHGYLRLDIQAADEADARKANLKNKIHIKHLDLHFAIGVRMEVILESLQPPPGIETLYISGYGGKWFPKWLLNPSSLDKLKELSIYGFYDCPLPPVAELPCLEKLYIGDVDFKRLTSEFLGIHSVAAIGDSSSASSSSGGGGGRVISGFPKLKALIFRDCESWEEWEDISDEEEPVILPCLKELEFRRCPELKGLPHNLLHKAKSLETLRLRGCNYLQSLYNPKSGTYRKKVSNIPYVVLDQ